MTPWDEESRASPKNPISVNRVFAHARTRNRHAREYRRDSRRANRPVSDYADRIATRRRSRIAVACVRLKHGNDTRVYETAKAVNTLFVVFVATHTVCAYDCCTLYLVHSSKKKWKYLNQGVSRVVVWFAFHSSLCSLFAHARYRLLMSTIYRFTECAVVGSPLRVVLEGFQTEIHRISGSSSRVGDARVTRITRSISRGYD